MLFLEQAEAVAAYPIAIQAALVIGISIPYLFLGVITYAHPYKTMVYLFRSDHAHIAWSIAFGGGLWANLSVAITFGFVHWQKETLNVLVSQDTRLQYLAVYGVLFSVFCLLFAINARRLAASSKTEG